MARYVANSTGNFNTAATWDTVANTPTIHATSNTSVTTAGILTDTFTAPNTTNAATGCLIYVASYPIAGRNWTAELEESTVATGSIATILQTDMPTTVGWIYFRLATPYTYTTTAAGAYRWRIKSTTANSGVAASNSGSTAIAVMSTDDRNTAPASTANAVYILPPNCTTAVTVTVDGTAGVCGGTSTSLLTRQVDQGILLGGSATNSLAILKWDTAASATLKNQGSYIITDGGEHQMGTVATPYPTSFTAIHDQFSSSGTARATVIYGTGKFIMQGRTLTYYVTTYVSGTGIAASPLVVSDPVDWTVGDRILVTATSANGTNYNENEYRFIITKNSSTSYVLSATSGGAEAAFTYTHTTNAKVLNLQRNVKYQDGGSNKIGTISSFSSVLGNVDVDWATMQNLGVTGGAPVITNTGAFIESNSSSFISCDYSVFDLWRGYALGNQRNSASYTNNIFTGGITSTVATIGGGFSTNSSSTTITSCYFINNAGNYGVEYNGINCTFTDCYFNGNNTGGTTNKGGLYLYGGAPATLNTCEFHCNRFAGVVAASTTNTVFNTCLFGTKGVNQTADIYVLTATANKILANNSTMSSTSTVANYLNGAIGATLIAFDTMNGTANNHKWYTEFGSAQSTGSGLSDTTVRTSGTLNVRLNPEDLTTGFKYEYKILAVPSKAVFALGFIQRNAAFATDTCLVELFLPGSTSADASQTMATTVGTYLPFSIAAAYTGSLSRFATVRISGRTTTASAYVYIADLFNGTNNITDLTTWFEGQPSSIMFEQLGDAAAVWAVPTSTLTTSATTGKKLVDLLEFSEFVGLK